jgi:hypothetical protein
MMRDHGWHSYKGQWVEKHRRQGAGPETLNMYFDELLNLSNIIHTWQELDTPIFLAFKQQQQPSG